MDKLIIFEGPDGSGKTTQIKLLEEKLIQLGKKVIVTREPGGTSIGEKIRELILNSNEKISIETEIYLFAASRRAHNEAIAKWIKDGYIVLCDRNILSSYIYQTNEEITEKMIDRCNYLAMEPIKDILGNLQYRRQYSMFLFDISVDRYIEINSKRHEKRGLDNIEQRYKNKQEIEIMLKKYKTAASSFFYDLISVDNKSIEEIHQEIINLI